MTTLERTFLPAADAAAYGAIADRLGGAGTAELVLEDGTRVALPAELGRVLRMVASVLQQGEAVTVAPIHSTLTTQQAADMLGVSRPTLITLLERGEIPYTKPGRHRRILLTDLLGYQAQLRDDRARALDELAARSEAAGLDDEEHLVRRLRR
jgi:excisionase family DNA binding protein